MMTFSNMIPTMKKKIALFGVLLVASLVTIASCAKVEEALVINKTDDETYVDITVTANSKADLETRTAAVDGANPYVKWLSTDAIELYEVVDDAVFGHTSSSTTTLSGTNDESASFKATLSGSPSGSSYKYSAVYPAEAVGYNSQSEFYYLIMPDTQTLVGSNFSEDSDLLISGVLDHSTTRVVSSESLSFSFRRVGTIVRLKLSGITANEKIKKVVITAPVNVAGRLKYDPVTGKINTEAGIYYGGTKTITLNVNNITATGTDYLWFRVISVDDWAKDSELAIEVETDAANYYRNGVDASHAKITLPKAFEFEEGGLTAFGVSLGSYRVAKPVATVYTLVEDSANIVDGAEYLFVSSDGTHSDQAMSTTYSSNVYGATDVTISSNNISITSEPVKIVTLEDAGNGKFFLQVGDNDYLYYSGSSNNVSHDSKPSPITDSYKWTVSLSSIANVATSGRKLQYNYNNGNPRFACYTSTQKPISLYVNSATVLPLGVSFENAKYILVKGSDEYNAFSGQTLTKESGSDTRSVKYAIASDANSIITSINSSTGAVILSGNTGTATISASVGRTAGVNRGGSLTYDIQVSTNAPKRYIKATSVESGAKYLIAAKDGDTFFLMNPASTTAGYLAKTNATLENDGSFILADKENLAFTISTSSTGYSLVQNDGKYLAPDASSTKLIASTSAPTYVWSIVKDATEDYCTIKYNSDKYIQYSPSYSTYGCYSSEQSGALLPYLYMEDDGNPHISGTDVTFTDPTADIETSTLSIRHLSNVTYDCTEKPAWIESVSFEGNTMNVESKDNKGITSRNGIITVKATGDEGNISTSIAVSQAASLFEASSTSAMNFKWNDETNSTVKSVTIRSTYTITEASNVSITGANADKFVASLAHVNNTDQYTLEVWVVEDNETENNYSASLRVSRDGINIDIALSQAHYVSLTEQKIYTTSFAYTYNSSTQYQSSSETTGTDSGSSSANWSITYGNWNSSTKAQFRIYKTGGGFGTLLQKFDLQNVTKVYYTASAQNSNSAAIKLNAYYSTDGGNKWTKVVTDLALTTSATEYNFTVSETGQYESVRIKFEVSSNSTKPNSGNVQCDITKCDIYGMAAPK